MPDRMPPGCYVTMVTPFDADGAIDWPAFDQMIEWYIASGCVGIFTPCLSSEMYELTDDERLAVARRALSRAAGRAQIVSVGTYGGPIEDQADFVLRMVECCDAVVVNTSALASEDEDDSVWRGRAEQLLSMTGDVPLGLYECPVPYKRLLTPELAEWCGRAGRFYFHKDTSCRMADIRAKLHRMRGGSTLRFFNANVETLLPSVRAGGAGFSGISANFYPHLHAWLCANAKGDDAPMDDLNAVQDFLTLAEATVCVDYPASAKTYLSRFVPTAGVSTSVCRKRGPDGKTCGEGGLAEHKVYALGAMHRMQRELCRRVGIAEVDRLEVVQSYY